MPHLFGIAAASFAVISLLGCAGIRAGQNQSITVLTYNIHHGEGTDGRLDLERIAQIIKASKADLVALQEVDQSATRSGKVDQTAELARLTGMHGVFGRAMDFQGGGYGQAVLSKWPIRSHQVHQLPQRPGREPRIALAVELETKSFIFASTHLDHEIEAVRRDQVAAMDRLFRSNRVPAVILAGDFNTIPESPPMRSLWPQWLDTSGDAPQPTIPAGKPTRRIDYILATPKESWTAIRSSVLEESIASDHRPVRAILTSKP